MTRYCFTGLWGGALWTALLFLAVMLLPGESCALVSYGAQVSHQANESTTGSRTSTVTQDKVNFYYNVTGRPSSRMSLAGKFRFDILKNERQNSEGTQVQPSLNLNLNASGISVGVGYREALRDDSIISGNITRNLSSNSKDLFFDGNMNVGRLPSLRLRYGTRRSTQDSDGTLSSDTNTNELSVGTNFNVGIFAVNADYRVQDGEDRISGLRTDAADMSSQFSMAKNIGKNLAVSLRENYSYSRANSSDGSDTERSTSTAEAKLKLTVLKRGSVSSTYIYKVLEDLLAPNGTTTEKTWSTSASYTFPKYVRLYSTYTTRETDSPDSLTGSDTTVAGINFKHRIGRFDLVSRYEKRVASVERTTRKGSVATETERDNFDWVLNVRVAKYLAVSLSESYVLNTVKAGETSTDQYRLKLNFGPVKNLLLAPYMDHTITTNAAGVQVTSTQFNVPASYRLLLHDKLEVNLTDNYAWRGSGGARTAPASQTNNAVIRLTLRKPLPGTTVAGDASFSSSQTGNGPVSTTSSYSLSGSWSKYPHNLSASIRYQEGSNSVSSTSYSMQYSMNLRLRKLLLNLQARYSLAITDTVPESTAQSVYVVLSVKK